MAINWTSKPAGLAIVLALSAGSVLAAQAGKTAQPPENTVQQVALDPPVQAIITQEQPDPAQALTARLETLTEEASAAAGGTWAAAAQRADGEACSAAGSAPMQAASLVKLFVAAAVQQERDAVEARESYAGETAQLLHVMLSESDNAATNTLVTRLGAGDAQAGMAKVNAYCAANGYADTAMGRLMLEFDAEHDNFTSVTDCCAFLRALLAGKIQGGDAILDALKQQTRTGKIPAGVPAGVQTANKTGELDTVENDAAIVWAGETPYILCVMAQDLPDPATARSRITALSQQVYAYFDGQNGT